MKALLAAALFASCACAAFACGTCDEDKVAATYDHAVIRRAARAGDAVVFCAVQGRFEPRALAAATRRLRGVDPASVRVSREPAALSFALDVRKQPVAAALRSLQGGRAGPRIVLVRVNEAR